MYVHNMPGVWPLKIYLAARYGLWEAMQVYGEHIEALGHETTSSWYHDVDPDAEEDTDPDVLREEARLDIAGIEGADLVIVFTEALDCHIPGASRGGRHVEMGVALGMKKSVWIVGPRENIFCHHPNVVAFDTFDEVLHELTAR